RDAAIAPLPNGHRAIVPGKPQNSPLVQRILSHGADIMPPAYANKPLSQGEKAILVSWVRSGAPYRQHWAFVLPRQAPLPAVKLTSWPRNPIDNFVLARLEKAGLKPSPPADRYTLVRRVYLDLIGLPPTPEEADAFVQDRSPNAYEKVVDRLLASPHYGERWARRWLDLARYSDTNGYEKDRPRSIWPYRDWVINALNRDMPFDRFTIEQLAGDLLPNATQDQRVATGFHRNTMLNEEGGIDPLEYRFYSMVDRVATTGTVWLGLTLGCAQCHTHKFDPITQREYYRTMACLDNADELTIDAQKPDIAAQRKQIEAQIAEREAHLAERFPDPGRPGGFLSADAVESKFGTWARAQEPIAVRWHVLRPVKVASNLPLLTVQPDNSVFVSGDMTKRDVYDLDFRDDGPPITAVRLEALTDDRLPAHGPGRVFYEGGFGDFFLSEITLAAGGKPAQFASAAQSGGGDAGAAIDGDPQTGWNINGRQGETTVAVFRLKAPVKADAFSIRLLFERYHAAGLGRFRLSVTSDARPAGADLPPAIEEILLIPEAQRSRPQTTQLFRYYLSIAPELKAEREQIARLRATSPAYPTTLVFAERPADNPRATYIHKRGEWLQPTERVTPGVPAILPPLPVNEPANRLTFARWLVSPANPLVGRVIMNRQWAAFFGKGIVRTAEDFGYQGEPPSHPELLDWLAVEFVRRGWSLKQMHRLIVTSATYRQSSAVTPTLLARDPENRLLSRSPRVRLEAELVRDAALTASGLLSGKIGGPSVFPPQPP
ncbi:MAG TPA: PSD1 and planctomycete cytochrome C domain-containing protein, partial [Chthonomonadaceae bacterium]|nr:PSD1 and planctomycete cytochrome C domain-containing protein [Chthonomonadaceae bacterium]